VREGGVVVMHGNIESRYSRLIIVYQMRKSFALLFPTTA
jgi:hypothetical protein